MGGFKRRKRVNNQKVVAAVRLPPDDPDMAQAQAAAKAARVHALFPKDNGPLPTTEPIAVTDGWQVAVSHDHPPYRQWMLQYKSTNQKTGEISWASRSFCQTRPGLFAAIRSRVGVDPETIPALASLPAFLPQNDA